MTSSFKFYNIFMLLNCRVYIAKYLVIHYFGTAKYFVIYVYIRNAKWINKYLSFISLFLKQFYTKDKKNEKFIK